MALIYDRLLSADSKPWTRQIAFRLYEGSLGSEGTSSIQRYQGSALADSGATITEEVVKATPNSAGFFSVSLVPGHYYVYIGAARRHQVYVGTDSTYLLHDLLGVTGATASTLGSNFRVSGSSRQLLNVTTGGWHTFWITVEASGAPRFSFAAADAATDLVNTRDRDGMYELVGLNPSGVETGTWHAPYLTTAQGIARPAIAIDGSTPFQNWRIEGNWEQLYDRVTHKWRNWYISGVAGQETLSFGPEVP